MSGIHYELWDYETGNAIDSYATLPRALAFVQEAVLREGEGTLSGLILFEVQADGDRRLVARDRDLIPMIKIPARAD